MTRPSPTLRLAMALADDNATVTGAPVYARDLRARWRTLSPEWRRYWLRKAHRVLPRLRALGLEVCDG